MTKTQEQGAASYEMCVGDSTYEVHHEVSEVGGELRTVIYDGGERIFGVRGHSWTADQLLSAITVYKIGERRGAAAARAGLQAELRQLLGAATAGQG